MQAVNLVAALATLSSLSLDLTGQQLPLKHTERAAGQRMAPSGRSITATSNAVAAAAADTGHGWMIHWLGSQQRCVVLLLHQAVAHRPHFHARARRRYVGTVTVKSVVPTTLAQLQLPLRCCSVAHGTCHRPQTANRVPR